LALKIRRLTEVNVFQSVSANRSRWRKRFSRR
jgi:hypothetical protein